MTHAFVCRERRWRHLANEPCVFTTSPLFNKSLPRKRMRMSANFALIDYILLQSHPTIIIPCSSRVAAKEKSIHKSTTALRNIAAILIDNEHN